MDANKSSVPGKQSKIEILMRAVYYQDIDSVRYLLSSEPRLIDVVDQHKNTPLHHAVVTGNVALACLTRTRNTINSKNGLGETPLHRAALMDNKQMVDFLLKCGATADHENTKLCPSPIAYAARRRNKVIVELLLKRGARMTGEGDGMSSLYTVAQQGDLDFVRYLIGKGAKLSDKEKQQKLLMMALTTPRVLYESKFALCAYLADAECLIECGYELNDDADPLLINAVSTEDFLTADWLVSHDVDINLLVEERNTLVHCAVMNNNSVILRWLLENNAKYDEENKSNKTPLALAVERNLTQMVDILVSVGAKVCFTLDDSASPYSVALLGALNQYSDPKHIGYDYILTMNQHGQRIFLSRLMNMTGSDLSRIEACLQVFSNDQIKAILKDCKSAIEQLGISEDFWDIYNLSMVNIKFYNCFFFSSPSDEVCMPEDEGGSIGFLPVTKKTKGLSQKARLGDVSVKGRPYSLWSNIIDFILFPGTLEQVRNLKLLKKLVLLLKQIRIEVNVVSSDDGANEVVPSSAGGGTAATSTPYLFCGAGGEKPANNNFSPS